MNKKPSQTSILFKKAESKLDQIYKSKDGAYILDCFANGKNLYMRSDRLESSSFDMTWINKIEACIPDLGDIINNPRENTKSVTSIVPVELAKKTNAESVRHLASHTQFIKEVNENGSVIPSKILTINNEQDLHTYENKFIATLVRKLVLFIEKRYEFIQKFAPLHDEEVLYFKSKTTIDGAEVEVETKVKVRSESETEVADISNRYVSRINEIREYVQHFYKSPFMKAMKTEKNVRAPILMTNILRKNVKYHNCYELYRFIEKYDNLGVAYKVDDDVYDFSPEEMKQMAKLMGYNYLSLKAKDKKKYLKQTAKTYKPRILTSLDDESFVYGDLYKGPIEFLRVDEGYLDYLANLNKVEMPSRPNKQEKEYFKEDVEAKKKALKEKAELEKLLRRKKKEQQEFEKKAKAIIAQREKEEALARAAEEEKRRLEEEARIEAMRQNLIKDAKEYKKEHKQEKNKIEEEKVEQKEPVVEEPIPNQPVEEQPLENQEVTPAEVVEQPQVVENQEVIEQPETNEETDKKEE
ncbi:MAG: hypothetical protein E7178_03145 [Erysipelotrichaceae bacterium]|nr:hypothetical protein [Erysipelotrichaceae bacterium]